MSAIRYSVEHENHSPSLVSHFKYLMQMQILVDTTLVCNSNMLKVHKVVLAATSSYFQDIFKERPGEHIFKLKMSYEVLKYIVEFMYSGKTSFLDVYKGELLAAARFLKIRGLMELILDFIGPLPEFSAPIIINQPVDIKHDSLQNLQMPINDDILDSLLVHSSQNNKRNTTVVVHIPIGIENSHYKALGKRRRSTLNKCLLGDSNEHKSSSEQKLLKRVAKELKNVEECSIKTIRRFQNFQEKQDSNGQLETSETVVNMLNLEAPLDCQQNNITNSEINNVDKMELLHPFYKENSSQWMHDQDSVMQNQIHNKEKFMGSQSDDILNCGQSSANIANFSRAQQMTSVYNLQISDNEDLMNNILTISSENCYKHSHKTGTHIPKNSQNRVKRRRDKFNIQSLNEYEYSPAAQHINMSIAQLELSEAVNSIFDEELHADMPEYNTFSELSNTRKEKHLDVYTPFFNKKKSGCIIDQNYSMCDKEVLMASQCEDVLKSAGLPTDVPILYKSHDGSYLNLTGETLLDMVQNNSIEFEIIEHKDLIGKNEISEEYNFADES